MTSIKEQLRDMYEAPTLEECKKRKDQIIKNTANTHQEQ